jgi:hypothetical protein
VSRLRDNIRCVCCIQGGSTEEETEHVRNYYTVLNYVLAVADIEKM